jgi:hypothetical protein
MRKGDSVVLGARTWGFVHHLDTVVLKECHLPLDAVGFEADMVESLSMFGEETSHRGIIGCRAQQFDLGPSPKLHKRHFDFLLLHDVPIDDFAPHDVMVEGAGTVKIADGNGYMRDILEHLRLPILYSVAQEPALEAPAVIS